MEENFIKVPENFSFKGLDKILTDPDTQNYKANMMQQQIQNVIKPPKIDYEILNPHEKTEQLL